MSAQRQDTQWPQFEVFLQDRNGRPHKSVGSVHAPDGEMALLNARDLFGRRPDVVNLWVIAADQILAKTAAELAADASWPQDVDTGGTEQTYYVFQKQSQRRAMTFVVHTGEVKANNVAQALQKAINQFDNTNKPTFVWWICPANAITRSEPDDVDSLFAPALSKHYKHPYDYKTFTTMRKAKRATLKKEKNDT